ncbi:MAG TPA: CHASE domain-containing protein [Phycisphaerae bacterium]|nr:CHASE domain-containing protein [Phycisphaerae bacterium]HXK86848.1 CHASE domain-containing protein [Phycisphaerae bacterium]
MSAYFTQNDTTSTRASAVRRGWVPLFVLIISLVATALGTLFVTRTIQARQQTRFQNAAELTAQHIKSHMETYVALLNGAQGLFAASQEITADEFRNYVGHLELDRLYPGIQGIGFTKRVLPGEQEALIAQMRQEGFEDFSIWPAGPRPEYHAIIHIEPLDWRNRRAIGYDMFADPTRQAAMVRARDTGRPAASGKVRLVQETDEQPQAGFLIYVPVYRNGKLPDSVEARRAALEGFVYSPFRADDLFRSILTSEADLGVEVEFFDTAISPEKLLHDSRRFKPQPARAPPNLSLDTSFEIAGRTFALRLTPGPRFDFGATDELPALALLVGITLSLLLYSATASLAKARAAAERTTAELRRTEAIRARRTQHLALRAEVSTALTAPNASIPQALQLCAEAAIRHLQAALVRIWTIAPEDNRLQLQASAGLYTHLDGPHAQIPLGQLKIGRIAESRTPLIINNLSKDPSISDPDWAIEQGLASLAGFPLVCEDRPLGVIALFSRQPLAEDTLDVIQVLADLLAHGIERLRAEEALRNSEERFRATFNQAAVGIALASPEGRFEQVNARFCEITDSTQEKLAEQTWQDMIHPEDRSRYDLLYRQLLAGEINMISTEIRCLCQGRTTWLALSMSAVRNPQGRPEHTIGVCRDITARKRAEQTVIDQKRELEDFVSIVAHDLKHPVVSVQGLLGLLKQDTFQTLDENSRENLEMALAECKRMKNIIAQLGHIVRIGSSDVRLERVHLATFLNEVVRRFKPFIEKKGVQVTIDAPDVSALLARSQVEEALDNLLDNALQHGCIGQDRRIVLRSAIEPATVVISVQDHGPGIDPRFHHRIFEMFRRLHPGGSVEGTGVGLAAVQRLLKRIGGTVTVDSAQNRGATFTVRIPAQILNQPESVAIS